ncbi:hypothetical protein HK100_003778 [Physocladia obscura]|uniref:Uncharacterized protein n=1 Tax=Physocladia obscura TaxID=109957 RepID=A0AAD5SWJ8_9FUNG|nr:hypothetical protein HK100_003778 [Physocladia obscura]
MCLIYEEEKIVGSDNSNKFNFGMSKKSCSPNPIDINPPVIYREEETSEKHATIVEIKKKEELNMNYVDMCSMQDSSEIFNEGSEEFSDILCFVAKNAVISSSNCIIQAYDHLTAKRTRSNFSSESLEQLDMINNIDYLIGLEHSDANQIFEKPDSFGDVIVRVPIFY